MSYRIGTRGTTIDVKDEDSSADEECDEGQIGHFIALSLYKLTVRGKLIYVSAVIL